MSTHTYPRTKSISASKVSLALYWITTGLLAAFLLFAAFGHITLSPEIVANTQRLGFPTTLMPFLGTLKILAVITILWGRRNDLTIGAYAGVFFYGVGAVALHLTSGDPLPAAGGGIFLTLLALTSYALWRRTRGRVATATSA